ncbi:unnamed protein product [Clonostachys rosea f. rosea IK726]|uniref:Uncharacterized protein n=1 Tax=Clonostachys rosea f. rosea IK726 TaxID=1349383 RepID=A0ACA9U4Y9_BIOOC|nr:unnamed protein product [Clonostachys rosea f. rosea IK726]
MSESKFRVLIVGGSVTGLTIANMLERAGIDYLVLEAYNEIAPQIGASIGLVASGLRILDQLGCAKDLIDLVDMPLENMFMRNGDGSLILHQKNSQEFFEERHGYPTIFIDRQMLLQRLHKNLKSTKKVLSGKKVKSIETIENSVQVTTTSGETFHGDILVGADGIYSTVRQEMHRIAQKESTDYFPEDEWSKVPCDYRCIFGISQPTKRMSLPGIHFVLNKHKSYLVITGPGGRVYWFLMDKLPKTMYGDKIPKYTKDEELALAAKYASDPITTEITFGELYAGRTSSVLTPLHEYAFTKWFYKRAITIGDSAHKFEPITGQGGNSAIESAAAFVNNLTAALKKSKGPLTNKEIEALFEKTQEQRFDRVSYLISLAHKRQQSDALETPIHELLAKTLPVVLPREIVMEELSRVVVGAEHLHILPKPTGAHSRPWGDELPAAPFAAPWILGGLGFSAQAYLFWLSGKAMSNLTIPLDFMGGDFRKEYVHVKSVDGLLSVLVRAFGKVLSPSTPERMQLLYFMPVIMSTILDWMIDGYRAGSQGLPLAWPSVFGSIYQLSGIGRIAPLYNALNITFATLFRTLGVNTGRTIPPEVSKALLPSITLGYVLPSILLVYPFQNKDTWQKYIALWQPFPVFVGVLTTGLSKFYASKRPALDEKLEPAERKKKDRKASLQTLRRVYAVGFGVTALCHVGSMISIWNTPGQSVSQVLGNLGSPFAEKVDETPGAGIPLFFRWDMALNCASAAVQGVHRIWELRSYGYITTASALRATLLAAAGTVVAGPAATQIGIMAWREEILVGLAR